MGVDRMPKDLDEDAEDDFGDDAAEYDGRSGRKNGHAVEERDEEDDDVDEEDDRDLAKRRRVTNDPDDEDDDNDDD